MGGWGGAEALSVRTLDNQTPLLLILRTPQHNRTNNSVNPSEIPIPDMLSLLEKIKQVKGRSMWVANEAKGGQGTPVLS